MKNSNNTIDKILKRIPGISRLKLQIEDIEQENSILKKELAKYKTWAPPGHFYSPNPDIKKIQQNEKKVFGELPSCIPAVNLNVAKQMAMLEKLVEYYSEIPFKDEKNGSLRYFFKNPNFAYTDGIFLYSMIRHIKPKKIIEIGSGYSSCVMLDTNEIFFDNKIDLTFIEPYPELLFKLIKETDKNKIKLIDKDLQDLDIKLFSSLEEGDILFVDSTHVSKFNSDVNYIFFQLLPALKSGVYIHFHDIFYPFEYPKHWIYEGRAWNEYYLMRAFLEYNAAFEILLFIDYLQKFENNNISSSFSLTQKNQGAGIWIQKK